MWRRGLYGKAKRGGQDRNEKEAEDHAEDEVGHGQVGRWLACIADWPIGPYCF